YDTYDNAHIQFGIDAARRPFMDRYLLDAKAIARGTATPITTLNFTPSGNPEGTALYTSRYGAKAPVDTPRQTPEESLIGAGRRGATLFYVRHGPVPRPARRHLFLRSSRAGVGVVGLSHSRQRCGPRGVRAGLSAP